MELESILAKHYTGQTTNSDIIQNTLDEHGYDVLGLDQLGWKLYKEDVLSEDEVKIILTEHPGGGIAWAESWSSFVPDHIYYFSHLPFSFIGSLQQVMKLQKEFLLYISSLASNESNGNSRSSNTSDDPRHPTFMFPATNLAMAYEKHNEAVKKKFRNHDKKNNNDRLLVFNPT